MLVEEKYKTKHKSLSPIKILFFFPMLLCMLYWGGNQEVQGADVIEFLNLEVHVGSAEIMDVARDASWNSSDNAVATFSNGRIIGHEEGVAVLKIRMGDGSTKSVNVSVFTKYPQPRAAEINDGLGGLRLQKFAGYDSMDYTGSPLQDGQVVEVLYRVRDQSTNRLMQYVRTSGGSEGYITSSSSNDRAMNAYYADALPGDTLYTYCNDSGTPLEDSSWLTGNGDIASVRGVTHDGYRNQGEVQAKKEGLTSITAVTGKVRTSVFVSVYSPISNIKGIVKNESAVRSGAGTGCRAVSLASRGRQVTISGRCGNYWRIGDNQFILISDVNIPATGITLNHINAVLYPSGDASSIQMKATVTPILDGQSLTSGKVTWSSSNDVVAQVSELGVISGKSGGKAVIRATVDGQTAECDITVCVPATKVTMPLVKVLAVKKSDIIKHEFMPANVWGNTITWTSSNTKIAKTDNIGKTTAMSQEGNAYIQVKSNSMSPTIGTKANSLTGRTLVSVYKPMSLTVMTKYANRAVYQGATTNKTYGAGTVKIKNTLLQVIGSTGNFYYARYLSDTSKRVFIRKSDVVQVTLIHKTVEPSRKCTLKFNKTSLLKASKNMRVSAAIKKGKNLTLNKAKRGFDGTITTKGEGTSWIQVKRTPNQNRSNPKIYIIHVTVTKKIPLRTGQISTSVKACLCAVTSCVTRTLAIGTKIKILGESGSYFRVSYIINKKEEIRYIAKSAVAYIDFAPVILGQGKTGNQGIMYYGGIDKNNTLLKSVTISSPKKSKKIAEVTIQLGRVSIRTSKSRNGYRVLKITAQVTSGKGMGTYITYAPITVFKPVTKRDAYIRVQTDFKNGAGTNTSYCTAYGRLSKNRKVILAGSAGNTYLIDVKNKNTGYKGYGFVKKRDLVYLELDRKHATISKSVGTLPTITVKIHNASGGGWSNTKGILTYREIKSRRKTNKNRGIEHVTTRVYRMDPAKEGAVDTVFTCGVLKERCYVSSYTPITDVLGRTGVAGYVNANTASRRIAGLLSRYSAYGTAVKNTALQLYGKCGSWFRVRFNNQSVWVAKSRVTYMMLTRIKSTMYQHHSQNIKAVVYNKKSSNGNSYSSSNSRTAGMSNNGQLNANYSGKVTVNAKHTYANGKYLQTSAVVNIKPIWITIKKSLHMIPKNNIEYVKGKKSMVVSYHTILHLSGTVFTLPKAKTSWSWSNGKNLDSVKRSGDILIVVGNNGVDGSIRVTAKYGNVKKTATFKTQGGVKITPLPIVSVPSKSERDRILENYFKQNPGMSQREKDIIMAMADTDSGKDKNHELSFFEKVLKFFTADVLVEMFTLPVKTLIALLDNVSNGVEGVAYLVAWIFSGCKNDTLLNKAANYLGKLPKSSWKLQLKIAECVLVYGGYGVLSKMFINVRMPFAKLAPVAFKKLINGLKKKFPKLASKLDSLVNRLKKKLTIKKTYPSKKPNNTSKPKGNKTKIPKKADEATKRGLKMENESAENLAKQGYNIEQNPKVSPSDGIDMTKKPDYRIEGKIFDHYAPEKNKSVRGIWSVVGDKLLDSKGRVQTKRVVISLKEWKGSLKSLKKQF